nr:hypothetical protein [Deltaproteobacteria bacterium]
MTNRGHGVSIRGGCADPGTEVACRRSWQIVNSEHAQTRLRTVLDAGLR